MITNINAQKLLMFVLVCHYYFTIPHVHALPNEEAKLNEQAARRQASVQSAQVVAGARNTSSDTNGRSFSMPSSESHSSEGVAENGQQRRAQRRGPLWQPVMAKGPSDPYASVSTALPTSQSSLDTTSSKTLPYSYRHQGSGK